MKTHVFRLRRGSDLLKALQEYARTRRIAAGTVVSGVGCVTRARVRDASGVTVRELNEPLEIVSLMGTLSTARTHLHIALAREDLTVLGGHLMEGCIVNTTAEVVLLLEQGDAHAGRCKAACGDEAGGAATNHDGGRHLLVAGECSCGLSRDGGVRGEGAGLCGPVRCLVGVAHGGSPLVCQRVCPVVLVLSAGAVVGGVPRR